ncbi:MAG: ATP-dependent sacrificial sulfur transferase LarE [Opitutae bacterium]|nr:ATP-dependent sacrificial sulfur transferase LarE [Opitutae bacterium]
MKSLADFFAEVPKAALGFSGGVDSSFLLFAAKNLGAEVKPFYVKSAFQPQFEFDDALKISAQIGIVATVLPLDVLADTTIATNPEDRCYFCKKKIFGIVAKAAREAGFTTIIDGTNASDNATERPGMRALEELSVRSPLRECGLTKGDVRRLAREAGLPVWDKPAYSCLATRIPATMPITAEILQKIERAENALFVLGFSNFRVRIFHNAARLQFPTEQFDDACRRHKEIRNALAPLFPEIFLDLNPRQQT